jgi:hypothetical protein
VPYYTLEYHTIAISSTHYDQAHVIDE